MPDPKTKILLIEDDPGDAVLIEEILAEAGRALFDLERVDRLSAGVARLGRGGIDVVLLDLGLPDSQGIDTLVKARVCAEGVPIVVLTGLDDAAMATRILREGGQDYLVKGQMDGNLLTRSIRYAVERQRLLVELEESRERERREKELRSLATLSSSPQTGVTARMYGVVSLIDGFPDTFRNLVDSYEDLMDLALDQQAYRVTHDVSGRLGAMAETLGFYKAGPRDVVDIHTTALKEKIRKTVSVEKKKAYTGEGWVMVLELMGHLVSFYRNRAKGAGVPTDSGT